MERFSNDCRKKSRDYFIILAFVLVGFLIGSKKMTSNYSTDLK